MTLKAENEGHRLKARAGDSRKGNNTCDLAGVGLQPLPTVSPNGDQDVINTGYWPQIAETHIKGMISVSPDSCIFPYVEKHLIP